MRAVGLTVNGIPVIETVEPRMHLADLLRERLGLTGTHLRCEQGACGTCTLLIDGQPARSCITYAVLCEGAQITTIEGLEDDPVMAALRQAFTAEHGLQCGFCTPGMLITARDIVRRAARPPRAERQPLPVHRICRHRARHSPRVGAASRRRSRRVGGRAKEAWSGGLAPRRAGHRRGFGAARCCYRQRRASRCGLVASRRYRRAREEDACTAIGQVSPMIPTLVSFRLAGAHAIGLDPRAPHKTDRVHVQTT